MSHWISVAQPPLRDPPSLQVGGDLYETARDIYDDPIGQVRKYGYIAAKGALSYAANRYLTNHPTLKPLVGVVAGPLIDIAAGHFPEVEAQKAKRKKRKRVNET